MSTCVRNKINIEVKNGQLNNDRTNLIYINSSEAFIQRTKINISGTSKAVKNNQPLQVCLDMSRKSSINSPVKIPFNLAENSLPYIKYYECEKSNSEKDSLLGLMLRQNNQHKNSGNCTGSFSPNSDISTKSSQSTNNEIKKFKTELCHTYELMGTCKYGANCSFAHGEKEKRDFENSKKKKEYLKNRQCRQFFLEGYCPYGQRCQFNHDILNTYQKLNEFEFNSNNKKPNKVLIRRQRLNVFKEIIPNEILPKSNDKDDC